MLTFTSTDNHPLEIRVVLRRPAVYLDTCIISNLAGTQKGEDLRQMLCSQGTLYISWAHLVEVFGLGMGPKFRTMNDYLKSFGPHFMIIDADVNAVMRREHEWVNGRQGPGVDEEFLRVIGNSWDARSEMSLGIILNAFANEEGLFEGMKKIQEDYKSNVRISFEQQRKRYGTDKDFKAQLDAANYGSIPSHWLLNRIGPELIRETVRTNEQFNPSDALDFSHAAVSVAYCDLTVLDKKWARRCRRLPFPPGSAAVYDGTEIDQFLGALSTFRPA